MTPADPTTLALTGQLPYILITTACLALPLSFFLLWLYRKAVLRGMARRGNASTTGVPYPDVAPSDGGVSAEAGSLDLCLLDSTEPPASTDAEPVLFRLARWSPWRAALVYSVGGLLFAVVMAFSFLRSGGLELLPIRFLLLLLVYLWPLVLSLYLIIPAQRRSMPLLIGLYGMAYMLVATVGLYRNPDSSVGQLVLLWAGTNLPPTLLLAVFLLRRVRAVGPLVVTFLVFAMTGTVVLVSLLEHSEPLLRAVAGAFFALGLGGTGVFVLLHLIGFVLFGSIGWFALQWIRRRYAAKKANDQSLILDALWLLFGITYSIGLAFEGPLWIIAGLVAFAVYKTAVGFGFRRIPSLRGVSPDNARLLLLRVFSLGKRSEALFEAVSRSWRYLGTVQLISGPDLAAATVEPHEFLDFLTGRLERQFIDGPESLQQRLADLDTRPDFDGRFRVNDFFCHDDTWQMTLGQLVNQSDAVLMDLRGFAPEHAGCAYELGVLVNTGLLDRVVLAIDDTTDYPLLEKTLQEAWQVRAHQIPHRHYRQKEAQIRIIRLDGRVGRGVAPLLLQLCDAASGRQQLPRTADEPG